MTLKKLVTVGLLILITGCQSLEGFVIQTKAKTKSELKQQLKNCQTETRCAYVHYEYSLYYIKSKQIDVATLHSARYHLLKAKNNLPKDKNIDTLLVLIDGWVTTLTKNEVLHKEVSALKLNIEKAKAIDLEAIN